jgi:type III restriction enzyme
MPRKKSGDPTGPTLLDARTTTAPCVPAVRDKVTAWRNAGYPGATDTTRRLLNYWFETSHRRPGGRKFQYHYAQRYAVETLIWLYEVAKVRRQKGLIKSFADRKDLKLLQYDDFARYCVKMATGSGKTKVMSLAVVWQYFNAVVEGRDDYAKTFLVIAPNVIVFERLRTDFEGGRVFLADPVVPPDLRLFWDFQCYMRGEAERAHTDGALYLTNVQQLHDRPEPVDDEPDVMTAVLGPKPPAQAQAAEDFLPRVVARGGPVCVLNNEAHHTHEEGSAWNVCIRQLHAALSRPASQRPATENGSSVAGLCEAGSGVADASSGVTDPGYSKGIAAQLDFTATPRHTKGQLFSWTVYDYPLKQAILDGIVKRPLKGVAKGISEQKSEVASRRYQAYLAAGVERWKEYREQLRPFGKKPVLFVMMNDTAEAGDVGHWLQTKYPELFGGDKLLVIHTNRLGEVSTKDEASARAAARDVDRGDSPVNCIVSVVMLREGWDVQNVTVIVGLRPCTAKVAILPEQTVGRGLRLMFRDQGTGYVERVEVIGNAKFIEFVEQLEKEEDLQLETFTVGKDKVSIVSIEPDPAKLDKDIRLPQLSPILARKRSLADEIAALDVPAPVPPLPRKLDDKEAQQFKYEGIDLVTLQKLFERDYHISAPQTAEEVIGYYARRIAQDVKLPSQFAALVPKVREFLAGRAFGGPVDLAAPEMVKAIGSNVAAYVTIRQFARELRKVVVEELQPQLLDAGRPLSETPRFPWSRDTLAAANCVFNLVPCENKFELQFARFLRDAAGEVERFAKLPEQYGFVIEYTDATGNLRHYEPDFVAVTADGTHYLIETKGQEDVNVAHKDRAARLWCENATRLTGHAWAYLKVRQAEFDRLQPTQFGDLSALAGD